MKKSLLVALTLCLVVANALTKAAADTISFTLASPVSSMTQPGELLYTGTITASSANAAPLFLNGDTFDFTDPGLVDDSPFLSNFPTSLASGQSFTGELFDVTLPPGSMPGISLGTFNVYGGSDANAYHLLGSADFSTLVPTPEPPSWLLIVTGIFALLICHFWKQPDVAHRN